MRSTFPLILLAALTSPAPAGTIDTLTGTGVSGSGGDGGPAASALLREPFGCELDGQGRLLIADAADGRVRRVDLASGRIATVAGEGPGRSVGTPYSVAVDGDGSVYIV